MEQQDITCFICQKQAGKTAQPPGGYIYQDEHWMVCHASVSRSLPGQLFVESRRHYLDFAEMTAAEAASYGCLMRALYATLKQIAGAERVYSLITLEGVPHFHVWLVPRTAAEPERGLAFLAEPHSCTVHEAFAMSDKLRTALAESMTTRKGPLRTTGLSDIDPE